MEIKEKTQILEQLAHELAKMIDSHDKSGIESLRVKEFMDFRNSLMQESDRGSVLMAAAFIEDKISLLLESYFINNATVCKRLLKGNGALATFSSKIDLAFLLGLIPENIFYDLHLLRRIRNNFAHNASALTFDTPSIKDQTYALSVLSKTLLRDDTKAYFLRSMTTILNVINMKMENFERCSPEDNFDPSILDEGLKIVEESLAEFEK